MAVYHDAQLQSPVGASARALAAQAPTAAAGTLVMALMLASGRWGSYLGASPIFLTDVLVFCAVIHALFRASLHQGLAGEATRVRYVVPFALCIAWATLRLLFGTHYDLAALRDFAPYAYAVVGIIGATAIARAPILERLRTGRILLWALGAHAAWMFVVVILAPSLPESLPLLSPDQSVHVLSVRNDYDSAITGVFAAWLLTLILRNVRPTPALCGFCAAWLTILTTNSRAGMIGAFFACVLAFIAALRNHQTPLSDRVTIIGLIPLVLAVLAIFIPSTNAGARLFATFGAGARSAETLDASATGHARDRAWRTVFHYSTTDPERALVGVGFGPDFMADSGALYDLVGPNTAINSRPRSPHSYWFGTFARLGLVGLVIFGAIFFVILLGVKSRISTICDEPLLLITALVPVALIAPFSLGVVMESPFGAIPFFWCSAVLLNYPRASPSGVEDA